MFLLPFLLLPCAFAQFTEYIDPSLSDNDLELLGDFIDSAIQFAYTTNVSSSDNITKTAVGYVTMNSSSFSFVNTEARETTSAFDIFRFPDIQMEITTYINPLPASISATATPYNQRRKVKRGIPTETAQCPVQKTITVFEWIDCAADVSCVCPTTRENGNYVVPTTVTPPCPTTTESCPTCAKGYEIILLGTPGPQDPPCSTVSCAECSGGYKYVVQECVTTTEVCPTCPNGYQVILIGTPGPTDPPTTKVPCKECSGGYKYVVENNINININIGGHNTQTTPTPTLTTTTNSDELVVAYGTGYTGSPTITLNPRDIDSDYAYVATLVISSSSKLVVSTHFPLLAYWSQQMVWEPIPTATVEDDFDEEDYYDDIDTLLYSLEPTQTYIDTCMPFQSRANVVPTGDGGKGINDPTGDETWGNGTYNSTDFIL